MVVSNVTETLSDKALADHGAPLSAQAIESLLAQYSQATDRVFQSYQHLQQDVVRLREELNHKNQLLERKSRLAALGEMAAGMAHEIRNPLGGIQLYVSLLERDWPGAEADKELIHRIRGGIRSLETIVSDILAFTHDHHCQKARLSLRGLLEEVIDYCRPQLNGHEITIQLDGIPGEMTVNADVSMSHRVFLNLLLNAIEAVKPRGTITLVAVEPAEGDYTVAVELTDSGPGIPPGIMERIFNPFFTTRETGTGLGLAIVYRLMECHGGTIAAMNSPDGGARFRLCFP